MVEEKIQSERIYHSHAGIRWGSIIGGWLFAYAFAMLLYLLGAAAGVTSLSVINNLSKGVTIGTGLWMVAAWIIATFIGALFAGRSAGVADRGTGMIHGLLVWALSGLMTLFIGSVQAATMATVGVGAVQGVAEAANRTDIRVPQEVKDRFSNEFKDQASQILSQNAAGGTVDQGRIRESLDQLDAGTITDVSLLLIQGNSDQARATLANNTDLSDEDIARIVNGLESRGAQSRAEIQGAGDAAEQAVDYTSAGLWALFFSSLLGLGAGAWGGAAGAALAARAYAIEGTFYKSSISYENEERERRKAG